MPKAVIVIEGPDVAQAIAELLSNVQYDGLDVKIEVFAEVSEEDD